MTNQHKLLIVDDDRVIHKMVETILQDNNFHFLNAYNGKEGVQLYKEHKPSLVLLDVDMPTMNGIEFLQHLDFKTSEECPVLVMSGLASHKEQERCLELGAKMFIGKPFQVVMLKKTIDYYLDTHRLSQ